MAYDIWVYFKAETSTDGGMVGCFWLFRKETFEQIPPIGFEIDMRADTKCTVRLDQIMRDGHNVYRAYQEAWHAFGYGELSIWEHCGWQKQQMSKDEVEEIDSAVAMKMKAKPKS